MKTLKVGEPWGDDPLEHDFSELLEKGDWKRLVLRQRKNKTVTLRMPGALIDSTKATAKQEGVAYQSLIRDLVVEGLERRRKSGFLAAEKIEVRYPKARKKKKA